MLGHSGESVGTRKWGALSLELGRGGGGGEGRVAHSPTPAHQRPLSCSLGVTLEQGVRVRLTLPVGVSKCQRRGTGSRAFASKASGNGGHDWKGTLGRGVAVL